MANAVNASEPPPLEWLHMHPPEERARVCCFRLPTGVAVTHTQTWQRWLQTEAVSKPIEPVPRLDYFLPINPYHLPTAPSPAFASTFSMSFRRNYADILQQLSAHSFPPLFECDHCDLTHHSLMALIFGYLPNLADFLTMDVFMASNPASSAFAVVDRCQLIKIHTLLVPEFLELRRHPDTNRQRVFCVYSLDEALNFSWQQYTDSADFIPSSLFQDTFSYEHLHIPGRWRYDHVFTIVIDRTNTRLYAFAESFLAKLALDRMESMRALRPVVLYKFSFLFLHLHFHGVLAVKET